MIMGPLRIYLFKTKEYLIGHQASSGMRYFLQPLDENDIYVSAVDCSDIL